MKYRIDKFSRRSGRIQLSNLPQSITKRKKLENGNEREVILNKGAAVKETEETMEKGKFRTFPRILGYMFCSDPTNPMNAQYMGGGGIQNAKDQEKVLKASRE